ncbi:MAG: tetratricopeptide repeat protein, partial [Firmicutes bacterium]|nr:tetratricopeptide repeat protein [Bacillota bacterium]
MDNLIQLGMTILSNPLVGLVTTALINLGTNQISSRLQMSKDIQQHYQEALEKAWQKFAQDVAYVYPGQMSVTDNNKQFWQCLQTEFQALLNQLTGDNSRALPDPESAGKCMSTALAKFLKVNRDGQITALAAKYLEYIKQEIAQRQALNDYLHNLNTEQMFVLLLQTYAITAQMDSKIDVIGATANQMDAKMDVIGTTNNKILDIVTGQGTGFNPATPSPPITSPPAQPVPGYIPREADLEAILTQLTAINNLASTYENLGRFQEALDLQMQLLDKRRTMLGEDHPDTLGAMHNLAITYDDLGRFQEALELQVQALDKR